MTKHLTYKKITIIFIAFYQPSNFKFRSLFIDKVEAENLFKQNSYLCSLTIQQVAGKNTMISDPTGEYMLLRNNIYERLPSKSSLELHASLSVKFVQCTSG